MNDFFHKLFSKLPHSTDASKSPNKVSAQDHSAHATRHQLVQMVLRTTLRKHGIPTHWIDLQELVVPGKTHGLGMHIRLVLRHWDAGFMNYAQAFQNQFLSDIKRYEPNYKEWLYGMSWQLEMNSSCPYVTLPDKPFWTAPAPLLNTGVAATPVEATIAPPMNMVNMNATVPTATPQEIPTPAPNMQSLEEHAQLERLFSARDDELTQQAEDPEGQPSFQDTQPLDDEKYGVQKV